MNGLRIKCSVPGCLRTRGRRKGDHRDLTTDDKWLCGEHWRLVPRQTKRIFFRLCKRGRRAGWPWGMVIAHDRIWARIEREAIETAVGIS